MRFQKLLLTVILLAFLCSCVDSFEANNWEITVGGVGANSSPKAIDLNGDDVLDIVIGAGGPEFKHTPAGVLAIDGQNGQILWQVEARNQMVATPIFTSQGTPNVVIGGRSGQLMKINGRNGDIIWEFMSTTEDMDMINDTTVLNFYNPQFINDINDDKVEDLLVTFGGFIKAKPNESDRPKGYLMLVSGKDGKEIYREGMPDFKETYMSPIVADLNDGNGSTILVGSGGETLGGTLYRLSLNDFVNQDADWQVIVKNDNKGYIAPPNIRDMNQDGVLDIIINAVDGIITCINGKTNLPLWSYDLGRGFEGYAMNAIADYVGDDGIPDVFATYGYGPWPKTEYTANFLLDGKDGSLVYIDTTGTFQYASPVSYDLYEDETEEIIMAINNPFETTLKGASYPSKFLGNELRVYHPDRRGFTMLRPVKIGSNLGSTPLLTDLDGDNHLDLISCYMTDPVNFYSFKKMVVERIELKSKKKVPFNWNSYMGISTNGIDATAPEH